MAKNSAISLLRQFSVSRFLSHMAIVPPPGAGIVLARIHIGHFFLLIQLDEVTLQ